RTAACSLPLKRGGSGWGSKASSAIPTRPPAAGDLPFSRGGVRVRRAASDQAKFAPRQQCFWRVLRNAVNIFAGRRSLRGDFQMRVVIALFAFLFASLPFGGEANAAADGKRIALLGTSNTNPYIGAWTSTFIKFATQSGMKVTNLSSNYD